MTLVELLIASTLLVVLMTAVMITMDMLNTVSNSVNAQYQEFQQALPALAPLQNLLRAEVEPGPPSTVNGKQIPQPGFQTIGNFSLTFFSDIGTAYNNVTSLGTTGGPAKVVALEVDATGNAVTTATTCSTSSPCNFQVRQYLPIITAGMSQCPTAGNRGYGLHLPGDLQGAGQRGRGGQQSGAAPTSCRRPNPSSSTTSSTPTPGPATT